MKPEKLRNSQQFRRVYDLGRRFHTPFFSVFILNNEESIQRIGITVTRKVGGAVVRNRCKRRLREIVRRHPGDPGLPGFDMVINVRSAFVNAGFDDLSRSFSGVLDRYRALLAGRLRGSEERAEGQAAGPQPEERP